MFSRGSDLETCHLEYWPMNRHLITVEGTKYPCDVSCVAGGKTLLEPGLGGHLGSEDLVAGSWPMGTAHHVQRRTLGSGAL